MAYKARRTRDLQGEVQAGTNVSVQETTKPDGTKVFTLSADSGEIPTLADMSNSIALFNISMTGVNDGDYVYFFPDGFEITPIQSIGDFYQEVETQLIYGGGNVHGIKFLQNGVYRINITIDVGVETTTTETNPFYISIINIDSEGYYSNLKNYEIFFNQVTTTKYSCVFIADTIIEVNSNDVISFIIEKENDSSNIISTYTNENQLYIQKVR